MGASRGKIEFFMGLVISTFPFLIFIHLFFSSELNYIEILGWKYKHGFRTNDTYIWFLINAFLPLFFNSIFFLITYQKWRYFLLPIIYVNLGLFTSYFFPEIQIIEFLMSWTAIVYGLAYLLLLFGLSKLSNAYRVKAISIDFKTLFNESAFGYFQLFNTKIKEILESKSDNGLKNYTYKVYYLLELSKEREKKINIRNLETEKFKITDLVMGVVLLLIGSLYIIYTFFPKQKELVVAGMEISAFGFLDIYSLAWYMGQKVAMIILLAIWFLSNAHWWRWALFSPLALYSYQFWDIFSYNPSLEEWGNFIVLPLTLITLTIIVVMGQLVIKQDRLMVYKKKLEALLENNINKLSKTSNDLKNS